MQRAPDYTGSLTAIVEAFQSAADELRHAEGKDAGSIRIRLEGVAELHTSALDALKFANRITIAALAAAKGLEGFAVYRTPDDLQFVLKETAPAEPDAKAKAGDDE